MSEAETTSVARSPAVQTPAGGRPAAVLSGRCQACAGPLGPESERRRQRACSARCRAILYRRRQAEVRAKRDREIRALLEAALRLLDTTHPGR